MRDHQLRHTPRQARRPLPARARRKMSGDRLGAPYGNRTRVSALRGPRPRPLDEGGGGAVEGRGAGGGAGRGFFPPPGGGGGGGGGHVRGRMRKRLPPPGLPRIRLRPSGYGGTSAGEGRTRRAMRTTAKAE